MVSSNEAAFLKSLLELKTTSHEIGNFTLNELWDLSPMEIEAFKQFIIWNIKEKSKNG